MAPETVLIRISKREGGARGGGADIYVPLSGLLSEEFKMA